MSDDTRSLFASSTSAARPCGTCYRCGGSIYENLTHTCGSSVVYPPLASPPREPAEDLAIRIRLRFWTCHRTHDPRAPNPVPFEDCRDCKIVREAEEALGELVRRSQRHA